MSLPTRIRVVPHFMRLHEWVALEKSHYRAEGLDPELLSDVMQRVSSHAGDPYFERPRACPSSPEEWRSRTRPASGARYAMPGPGWASSCSTYMVSRALRSSLALDRS